MSHAILTPAGLAGGRSASTPLSLFARVAALPLPCSRIHAAPQLSPHCFLPSPFAPPVVAPAWLRVAVQRGASLLSPSPNWSCCCAGQLYTRLYKLAQRFPSSLPTALRTQPSPHLPLRTPASFELPPFHSLAAPQTSALVFTFTPCVRSCKTFGQKESGRIRDMGSVFKCVDVNIRFVCMALWALPVNNAGRNVRVYRGADHALLRLLGARLVAPGWLLPSAAAGGAFPSGTAPSAASLRDVCCCPRKVVLVGHVNSD